MEKVVFVPGGMMPAREHYGPLIQALKGRIQPLLKDLEIFKNPTAHYTLANELEGIERAANEADFDSFHMVGYSTCIPVAYVERHPDRVITLTMVEPGMIGHGSFAPKDMVAAHHARMRLPAAEMFQAMARSMLAPGVDPPAPPAGPQPPGADERLRLGAALMRALLDWNVDEEALARFRGRVLVTAGDLGHPSLVALAQAIANTFPYGELQIWKETFHLNPAHRAEPEKFASALLRHWIIPATAM